MRNLEVCEDMKYKTSEKSMSKESSKACVCQMQKQNSKIQLKGSLERVPQIAEDRLFSQLSADPNTVHWNM